MQLADPVWMLGRRVFPRDSRTAQRRALPLLPSQNKLIQTAIPRMRAHARANERVNLEETHCYETYLALIAAVAKRCDMSRTKIVAVEMLLFSRAEKLVERASTPARTVVSLSGDVDVR